MLVILEAILWIMLFYSKNQLIVFPLFIVGLIDTIFEIKEFKQSKSKNTPQIARSCCLLFMEFVLLLNYFLHFIDGIFE